MMLDTGLKKLGDYKSLEDVIRNHKIEEVIATEQKGVRKLITS